jgi:hypothetical protein
VSEVVLELGGAVEVRAARDGLTVEANGRSAADRAGLGQAVGLKLKAFLEALLALLQ